MNKKIKIIPIFVPHIGCPNDCVFCNQRKITGKGEVLPNKDYATKIVEQYRKTIDDDYAELAFFGGSFTAIDFNLQEELLKVGKHYKDLGVVQRIRISTRPDAIDENILNVQKKYGVDIIELGIQSLDDEVLKKSNRGHTREHSINASKLIKNYGFTLGHQIMPGLPGSTEEKDIQTCIDSISMKPDIVRIYPTLTIKETELEYMFKSGKYKPLSLQEAVHITAHIYCLYKNNNINVIRIGLQNTETINDDADVIAGPYHPAFRQLVEEKIYLYSIIKLFQNKNLKNKNIIISANNKEISNISGQYKCNLNILKTDFSINKISFINSMDENLIDIYSQNSENKETKETAQKIGSFLKGDIYRNYIEQN